MPAAFYDTFLAHGRKVCPACRRRLALRVPAAPCFARALTTSCRILKNAEASMCVAYLPVPFLFSRSVCCRAHLQTFPRAVCVWRIRRDPFTSSLQC